MPVRKRDEEIEDPGDVETVSGVILGMCLESWVFWLKSMDYRLWTMADAMMVTKYRG